MKAEDLRSLMISLNAFGKKEIKVVMPKKELDGFMISCKKEGEEAGMLIKENDGYKVKDYDRAIIKFSYPEFITTKITLKSTLSNKFSIEW